MNKDLKAWGLHVLGVLAVFVVATLAMPSLGLRPHPVALAVTGLVAGTMLWLVRRPYPVAETLRWPRQGGAVAEVAFQADPTTRRLAAALNHAQPGRGFTSTDVAATLRELVADRLVRHHGADPDDPFADAAAHLSAPLHQHLTAEAPGPLPRPTLRRHLEEISRL